MKKETIDLTTAVKGDRFLLRGGSIGVYDKLHTSEIYKHIIEPCNDVHTNSIPYTYTDNGFYFRDVELSMDVVASLPKGEDTLPLNNEESAQDTLNKRFLHLIDEAVTMGKETSRSSDLTLELFNFLENRVGSAEGRIDILMGERGDRIIEAYSKVKGDVRSKVEEALDEGTIDLTKAVKGDRFTLRDGGEAVYDWFAEDDFYPHTLIHDEHDCLRSHTDDGTHAIGHEGRLDIVGKVDSEDAKKCQVNDTENLTNETRSGDLFRLLTKYMDLEESIEDHLDRELDSIAETTITPKALLDLGFTEEYQPPCDGEVGFIYYAFSKHGVELLSSVKGSDDFCVFFENQFEVHNLRKLGDLILSLNEV